MLEQMDSPTEVETKIDSLERQWQHPHNLDIQGKNIEVKDIKPEELIDATPIVIGLGWGQSADTQKENILSFAGHGRRVICADTPHGVHNSEIESYPGIEVCKMVAQIETIKRLQIEKVDAVAHSEGAIFTLMSASTNPDMYRNIILVNPAGLIGKDTLPRLTVGFSLEILTQFLTDIRDVNRTTNKSKQNTGPAFFIDSFKVHRESPLSAIRSVFAIADSDLRGMMRDVRMKGVKIAVISGVEDKAFPMNKMQMALDGSHVDSFVSTKDAHNTYLREPKIYSDLISEITQKLNEANIKNNTKHS